MYPMSARPSCRTVTWSVHVGPQHLDGEVGMGGAQREHRLGHCQTGHEPDGERRGRPGRLGDAAPGGVGPGQ